MKKKSITALIIGIGSAIAAAAFEWMPGVANTHRDWVNRPVLEVIRHNRDRDKVLWFAMKDYDIRTDELAEDCNTLRDRIKKNRKALSQVPPTEANYRHHLEEQIRVDEEELRKKERALDQAEDKDRSILSEIHGLIA